jgi:hypothetical protein
MNTLTAEQALNQFFLEARAKMLDLAAILDRIERGLGDSGADPRLKNLARALGVLLDGSPARAERVQQIFSLDYDPSWKLPEPRP